MAQLPVERAIAFANRTRPRRLLFDADRAAVGINGNGIGEPQDFRFAPNAHG